MALISLLILEIILFSLLYGIVATIRLVYDYSRTFFWIVENRVLLESKLLGQIFCEIYFGAIIYTPNPNNVIRLCIQVDLFVTHC